MSSSALLLAEDDNDDPFNETLKAKLNLPN